MPAPKDILTTAPVAATPGNFTVRTFELFEEAEPFRSAWDDLVLRSGADVYQTFDWCRLWWKHYGPGRSLQLLLCFSGEELVGLFPGFVETVWIGPVRLRVAKLVGSDYSLQLCNLAVLPDVLPMLASAVLRHFLGKHQCDALVVGPLSGPKARLDELVACGQAESGLVQEVKTLGETCNTYFDLPETFDEYLKAIGKQARGNLNRSLTQIGKAHGVTFDVVSEPDKLQAVFAEFRRLHASQWQAEGKLGQFGDWPNAADFNLDLVSTLGAQGLVRFHRILAGDRVLSIQLCYVHGRTNYWRLPARVVGPEWDKLSLGKMGLAKMIEAEIGEGRKTIEGGRGHYGYKVQMGGQELPLRTVLFLRNGAGVAWRARLFFLAARLLDVAYYKVGVMRLAPRVAALRRPLWPLWIRSQW